MVKAKGKTEFSFENITKKYGILYKNMDSFDKYTIFSIIMDSFHLDIFTKGFYFVEIKKPKCFFRVRS